VLLMNLFETGNAPECEIARVLEAILLLIR